MLDALRADRRARSEPARPFADAARSDPAALRIAVSYAFPPGVRGRLAPEVRGALEGTVDLLRGLGHTVVERDIDFRPRDAPVILGLLFRAIRDFVGEVERPARLERRSRAFARPGGSSPTARASGCWRPSGAWPSASGGSSTTTTSC